MENVHKIIYYVLSQLYVRKPSFNYLNFTFEFIFPRIPTQIYYIQPSQFPYFGFGGKDNITRGGAKYQSACSSPQPYHPHYILPPPISHLSPNKLRSMLKCIILRCRAPLEEYFPWVAQYIFSVYSPCSSFTIALTHPVHP